jgi:hypothetical protein
LLETPNKKKKKKKKKTNPTTYSDTGDFEGPYYDAPQRQLTLPGSMQPRRSVETEPLDPAAAERLERLAVQRQRELSRGDGALPALRVTPETVDAALRAREQVRMGSRLLPPLPGAVAHRASDHVV